MGRDCGMIALGTAYGQPDIILIPESPVDPDPLVERVLAILDIQKHAVLCVSEGIIDIEGQILAAVTASKDPAGNVQYTGAAEAHQAAPGRADRRRVLHPQAPQRERRRRDLHPQDRPHPARRPPDPLRPLLRLAARRQGRRTAAPGLPQLRGDAPVPRRRLRPRQHRCQQAPRPLGDHPRPPPVAHASTTPSGSSPRPRGSSTCGASSATPWASTTSSASAAMFNTGNLIHPYASVNVDINKRIRRLDVS